MLGKSGAASCFLVHRSCKANRQVLQANSVIDGVLMLGFKILGEVGFLCTDRQICIKNFISTSFAPQN